MVFGASVIVSELAVSELKIRVSLVRFRDWPPPHFKKPLIVMIEGFFVFSLCASLVSPVQTSLHICATAGAKAVAVSAGDKKD